MTKLEKAIKALETIGQRGLNDYGEATVASVFEEEYDSIKEAITYFEEELKYAEQRYKAFEEHFNNGVAYSTKIQEELNGLKRDVKRYLELTELRANEAIFPSEYLFTDVDWRELYYLEEKLLKVGKTNE